MRFGWILAGASLLVSAAQADSVALQTARQLFMQGSRGLPTEPGANYWCTARALPTGGVPLEDAKDLLISAESPEAPIPAFTFVADDRGGALLRTPETVSTDWRGRSDAWVSRFKEEWSFFEAPTCLGE